MDSTARTSLDHHGLAVISPEECWQLLADAPVGRVAFNEAGGPVVLPVDHAVVGHRILFRTERAQLVAVLASRSGTGMRSAYLAANGPKTAVIST